MIMIPDKEVDLGLGISLVYSEYYHSFFFTRKDDRNLLLALSPNQMLNVLVAFAEDKLLEEDELKRLANLETEGPRE